MSFIRPARGPGGGGTPVIGELTASGLVEAEAPAPLRELRRDVLTEADAEHYDCLVGECF
ncbi:hypothetical protein ACIQVA_01860 [Streptomyces microflavus]|uniref:hypothetical protein n=1 Tax=Streptomyces microflavus TaxID=1919 RepID=UPI0038104CCA